jgi:hypothetical protein
MLALNRTRLVVMASILVLVSGFWLLNVRQWHSDGAQKIKGMLPSFALDYGNGTEKANLGSSYSTPQRSHPDALAAIRVPVSTCFENTFRQEETGYCILTPLTTSSLSLELARKRQGKWVVVISHSDWVS